MVNWDLTLKDWKKIEKTLDFYVRKYSRFSKTSYQREKIRDAVFIGLIRATRSYDDSRGASFYTHASNCINSACIDVVKRTGGREALLSLENVESLYEQESSEGIEFLVRKCMPNIDARDRVLFALKAEGHTTDEIADILRTTRGSINYRILRVREKLDKKEVMKTLGMG